MSETKNVPKLRFPQFTEPWEQRKLGDVATFINGRAYSQDELLNAGKYKILRVGNFYTNDSWYYSDLELADKYYAEKGDLLYTWSATFGPHIWLSERVIYHYHIWKIEPKNELDKHFAVHLLNNDKDKITSDKNGSTMVHITKIGMENKDVTLPNIEEQKKLAQMFNNLNNLITLHQRKLDDMKEYKKGMLQKMFPKEGEVVPEIRFPGFTEPWEQRKLGEVLQTLPFKTFLKEPEQDGKYEIIQQGNESIIGYANGLPCNDYKDTVIFGDHTLSLYKPKRPFFVATDGVRIVKGKNIFNGFYLMSLLEKYKPQNEGYKRYYSILADQECYLTENPYEQNKIGQYFEHLDHLITLHQRKLDDIKEYKKGLLQQMFV